MNKYQNIIMLGSKEKQYDAIKNELFLDMCEKPPLFDCMDDNGELEKSIGYIAKYTLFIYYFIESEDYEYCDGIKKGLMDLMLYRGFESEEQIEDLITSSIEQYQDHLND